MILKEKFLHPKIKAWEFDRCPAGTVFDFAGEVFIKPDFVGHPYLDYAVKLYDGTVRHFPPETLVQPVDAELTYCKRLA